MNTNFTRNNNGRSNSNIDIPPQNDIRLAEIRAKQQERLNKITQINIEKKKYENDNNDDEEKKDIKLNAKQQKMKESVAYRYATTGKWSKKDDDSGGGGKYDSDVPRYRAPSAFQRYGRRPGGGGG